MNAWVNFLEKLFRDFRLSTYKLEKIYGLKGFSSKLSSLRSGRTNKLSQDSIADLERALNIKIDDSDPENITYKKISPQKEYEELDLKLNSFPLISKVYAGNSPMLFIQDNITDYVMLPYNKKDRCFAVRVVGDSMNHIISEGDTILVDMDLELTNGCIVVARLTNGKQIIKRYRRVSDSDVMFYSDNGQYTPLIISSEEIEAIYRIVGIWKKV